MTMRYYYAWLNSIAIIWLIYLSVGCASIPTQEMSDARQAIKAAYKANADYHVPQNLAQAESAMQQAELALSEGQFTLAKQNAKEAKEYAIKAYDMATAIERMRVIWQEIAFLSHEHDMGELFNQAEQFAKQGDVHKTLHFVAKLHEEGAKTLNRLYLQQTKSKLDKLQALINTLESAESQLLEQARLAYLARQGKLAYELSSKLYQRYFGD